MSNQVHSVSDITADIRAGLEEQFSGVWVEGEISNLRRPGSGHAYFTLKDSFAQLSCVFFRGAAARSPVDLRDGLQIQVLGDISVYEARGQYQLIAKRIQLKGAGDLQAKFEALKRKLDAEGLFSPELKQPLPFFPTTIGIVTSPTGAAIQDMMSVFARRAPWIRLLVYPVRVQGEEAPDEIAQGVAELSAGIEGRGRPDLIIVARGGGSIEDLWAFNEEVVARAIAASEVPVMSGVGHEIDFTIADFVADRREPTPSAAAENATPDSASLLRHLDLLGDALENQTLGKLGHLSQQVASLSRELQARQPDRKIQSWAQSLDYLSERMEAAISVRLQELGLRVENVVASLGAIHPEHFLDRARVDVERLQEGLETVLSRAISDRSSQVKNLAGMLHSLSPDATIRRGFTLTTDASGKLVTQAGSLETGETIRTRFADGEVDSVVS